MDLSIFVIFVVFIILVVYMLISYKPFRVEINEYMISVPNRKIYLKWNEIEKIAITETQIEINNIELDTAFLKRYSYVVTPKYGKILVFNLSQVKTPHPTLQIKDITELLEKKCLTMKFLLHFKI